VLNESHSPNHRRGSFLHTRLGDLEASLPPLERALELTPGDPEIVFQLGRNLAALGRLEEAAPHLERAAAARDDADSWTELGLLRRRRGDPEGAVEALRRALERDPYHPAALVNLGQTLVRLGRYEEGEAVLARHQELAPLRDRLDQLERSSRLGGATAANFALLAEARLRLGDREGAAEAWREALARDPGLATAAAGLASLALESGDLDAATRWAAYLVMKEPGGWRSYFVLGLVRAAKGEGDSAELAFAESRRRRDWSAETWRRAGDAHRGAGDRLRAEAAYREAERLAPGESGG
jgi:tetratricopeptide (TPR) repeat protein